MRDKHIAHSVNPFEETVVDFQLSNKRDKKILGVAVLHRSLISSSREGIKTLLDLARYALRYSLKQAKKSQNEVLAIGKKMPIDELYSKGRSRIFTPGPEDVDKPRN